MEADWKCLAWGEWILRELEQSGWRIDYTPEECFTQGVVLFRVKTIHVHWPEGEPDYAMLLQQIARVVRGRSAQDECPCDSQFSEAYLELVKRYMIPVEAGRGALNEGERESVAAMASRWSAQGL
jgi:hypothetical protein